MTFFSAFLQMLMWRPHRALAALYWHATRRRVRARNRLRIVSAQAPHAYRVWIETIERPEEALAAAAARPATTPDRTRFLISITVSDEAEREAVSASLASIRQQCIAEHDVLIVTLPGIAPIGIDGVRTVGARDAAQAMEITSDAAVDHDYIVPLAPGAILPPTALFRYAEAIEARDAPTVLFGDQDERDRRGRRRRPWFKPQWNAEMFLAQDYVSSACAIRAEDARAAGPVDADLADAALFALLLRIQDKADARIVHVPYFQVHLAHEPPDNQAARVRAVARQLSPIGAAAEAGPFRSVRVHWPLPETPPRVSVIVPTRDRGKLLRACLTGVLSSTRYPDFEVIVVDNGSTEPESLKYLEAISRHPRVRVIAYDKPYNYSAINNFAAGQARGDYLCLLNNDTEVLGGDWLTELMRYAVKPEVGAVGAKLLYDDGSIQHAGVVVGMGEAAGHAHRFLKSGDPGYFRQAHIPHYVSAVTAACLVVARAKFEAVGGLDEQGLRIAFNDVDLCLKLGRAGWRNVYAPQAVMIHHESKSRGKDHSPEHIDRYMRELRLLQERWGTRTHDDPLHHVNLERSSETFVIRL